MPLDSNGLIIFQEKLFMKNLTFSNDKMKNQYL